MNTMERQARAATLFSMRDNGRLPQWLPDHVITRALQLDKRPELPAIPSNYRQHVQRPIGDCPVCGLTAIVGCPDCWGEDRQRPHDRQRQGEHNGRPVKLPTIAEQVGILRTARIRGMIPGWLNDRGLARGYRIDRRFIARQTIDAELCRGCLALDPGELVCLACLARRQLVVG